MAQRKTRNDYEAWLNKIGCTLPKQYFQFGEKNYFRYGENQTKYGTTMRLHDPEQFKEGYPIWKGGRYD
jgi:hypothetical protein